MLVSLVTIFAAIICNSDGHLIHFNSSNNTANSSVFYVNGEEVDVTNNETDISNMSLEEICISFKIPEKNCTCPNEDSDMNDLCNLHTSKGKTVFSCDSISNIVIAICNIISSIIALVGNGFVIGFSITDQGKLSRFHHLIKCLAVSDFTFALAQFIISVPQTWTCHWVYGLFMCKILRAALAASANIAVGFIVIIAIDRYISIVYLFSTVINKSRLLLMECLNVLAGILSVVPPLVVLHLGKFTTCSEEWSREKSTVYTWFLFLVYYLLPIILLSVLYIILITWLKKSYLKDNILNDAALNSRLKKNKKVLIMLISVLAMFGILVLPNRVFWIINDMYGINNLKNTNTVRFLKMISEIPYGLHAAVNPIIYSVVDTKFRLWVKSLIVTPRIELTLHLRSTASQSLFLSNIKMNEIEK